MKLNHLTVITCSMKKIAEIKGVLGEEIPFEVRDDLLVNDLVHALTAVHFIIAVDHSLEARSGGVPGRSER